MYTLKIEFISGNVATINFESEAHRENYISYLFYVNGKLIKYIDRVII
jgi:hypothetical protein